MKAIRYTKRLIQFDSTSRKSNRLISKYLEMKLTKHGFVIEKIPFVDAQGVKKVNLVAKKGSGHGGLAYFCHTDVVPAKTWFTQKVGPFEPVEARERIYGRGACDMKGSIACMLTAAQQFSWEELKQPLYFICTADEEIGFHGARVVVNESKVFREIVSHGTKSIIGEPTSLEVVHAHKGSIEIVAESEGRSAHSSTREGINANLALIPFLNEMKAIYELTESEATYKNGRFQPSTLCWNITMKDNSRAINVTPARAKCTVYARTMPNIDIEPLLERTRQAAEANGLTLSINRWAEPLWVEPDSPFVQQSLRLAGRTKPKTVSFGTDGGVFTELQDKIVFGPGSIEQAHTFDEWISIEQLALGTELYTKMIQHWCCQ